MRLRKILGGGGAVRPVADGEVQEIALAIVADADAERAAPAGDGRKRAGQAGVEPDLAAAACAQKPQGERAAQLIADALRAAEQGAA